MPLRNRVTPFGEIVADPSRGTLMGNRGILHNERGELGLARWRHSHWVACVLSFRGRWRPVMAPRRYTELFFLDEATALAAGHRPCAECRNADYRRFRAAFARGHGLGHQPAAKDLDARLHADRVAPGRRQRTRMAPATALPAGAMIAVAGQPFLVWGGRMRPWSFAGYGAAQDLPAGDAEVLTPWGTVLALGAGYVPVVHPSAGD